MEILILHYTFKACNRKIQINIVQVLIMVTWITLTISIMFESHQMQHIDLAYIQLNWDQVDYFNMNGALVVDMDASEIQQK